MDLFAPIEPYATQHIDVGDGHSLYVEQSGNKDGVPVLFVHGGPGAGTGPVFRRLFDPDHYRIILVDQRGCGQSRPFASIHANTTPHLVEDFEVIRKELRVENWLLFGGSWGSTLALAYAQAYPERVRGFVLRGVFLFRPREVEWFIQGMGLFHPESFARFLAQVPDAQTTDEILTAYNQQLFNDDPNIHTPAALNWAGFEEICARLIPRPESTPDISVAISLARMENHYMVNGGFLAENQLLANMNRIKHLPAIIVQGRHDLVCPPHSAWELAQTWPNAKLQIIPDGAHSSMESPIRRALVAATQYFRNSL